MEAMAPPSPTNPPSIEDLKTQPSLWYKLHVLIHDLRNFKDDPKAQARLDAIQDASYIGTPYFDQTEAQQLKACVVDASNNTTLEILVEETLKERLERRMKKRVESGDYRVCAAHDLAPIFEKTFDIKPKDLKMHAGFLELLERRGVELEDGEGWKGLPKKSFQLKKRGKKR